MNYKDESTLKQTHRFPEQVIDKERGVIFVEATFSKQTLIECAQYKEYTLRVEIPINVDADLYDKTSNS